MKFQDASFNFPGGGSQQILGTNPQRIAIIFSVSATLDHVFISINKSTATANAGMYLSRNFNPWMIRREDVGDNITGSWYANPGVTGANANLGIIEVMD